MAERAAGDDGAGVNDLTPEEVSRIIHSHRKVRYGKHTACRTGLKSVEVFLSFDALGGPSWINPRSHLNPQVLHAGPAASAR